MKSDGKRKKIKISVVGKSSVGKTTMIKELMGQPEANVGDMKEFTLNLKVNDIDFDLIIIENTFENLEKENLNSLDGFLLVYSVDDKDSFVEAKKNHQLIVKKMGTKKFSLIFVGNKSDANDGRKVLKEEGERYCMETNVDFFEISSLEKTNVKECFLNLSQKILRFKYPEFFEIDGQEGKKTVNKTCKCF